MEQTAKSGEVKQKTPEQKAKAVEYLRRLDIFKPYIDGFVKNDNVCFFERFGGFWVFQEPEIEKKMREIEDKYGCRVYAITHEKIEGDDMWTFLVVTAYQEEWNNLLVKDGNGFYAFAYTWNRSYDLGSEFGDVFVQSFGGGMVKRSEELRHQLKELKALKEQKFNEMVTNRTDPTQEGWEAAWKEYYDKCGRQFSEDIRALERAIHTEINRELDIGDGVTMYLYSDAYACTVIAKTAKTITVQRDKATLDPNFKPEFIPGGFAAHCTNQEEQSYTYERDPNGEITKCYWSEKMGRFTTGGDQSIKIGPGRHEFYDYNF